MPTPLPTSRTSNKFENALEGLNITHTLRIIVPPLKKQRPGVETRYIYGVEKRRNVYDAFLYALRRPAAIIFYGGRVGRASALPVSVDFRFSTPTRPPPAISRVAARGWSRNDRHTCRTPRPTCRTDRTHASLCQKHAQQRRTPEQCPHDRFVQALCGTGIALGECKPPDPPYAAASE